MSDEMMLRVDEAARRISMGRSYFFEMLRRGEIASVKLGSARRVPVRALEEWMERKLKEEAEG